MTCAICGGSLQRLIAMPRLPMTERYESIALPFRDKGYADQAFLFCAECSHGQLENVIPPAELYGVGYRTKTSASIGSRVAIRNFASFIGTHTITVVIDIGGNDASLVDELYGLHNVIIDPNASGAAMLVNRYIEDADLSPWKGERKLIVSSHTLEHIRDPHAFMSKVSAVMGPNDTLAIQVPSLECLVEDARIEQIHHQHLHYYSLRSMAKLMAQHGLRIEQHRYDYDHYGALMVMARKGNAADVGRSITQEDILYAHSSFKTAIHSCANSLFRRDFIILGAALMLPLFAYHLPRIASAEYVADNDPSKDGLRYTNLDLPIRKDYDLKGRDVLIGAINTKLACRELVKLAFEKGARNVITPLHLL